MSGFLEGVKLYTKDGTSQELDALGGPEFYFDDEPLEDILYGRDGSGSGPTLANLYLQTNEQVGEFINAVKEANLDKVLVAAQRLGSVDLQIPLGKAQKVANALAGIIPSLAILPCDLHGLKSLLDKLWKMATETGNSLLTGGLGTPFFRWYEHHGRYEEARQVLRYLVDQSLATGDRKEEGILINNLAFNFFLEGRFEEALHWFYEAEKAFHELEDGLQLQNTRANILMSKFEVDDVDDLDRAEALIREIQGGLAHGSHWQQRKPHILFAMLEERRGNCRRAMGFVRKALACTRGQKSKYHEMDQQ